MEVLGQYVGLDAEEQMSMMKHIEVLHLCHGETLFSIGSPSNEIFFLSSGSVDLCIGPASLAQALPPSFFGGIGFLDRTARRSDCRVSSSSATVARISRHSLESLIAPHIALKILFSVGASVNQLLSGDSVYQNMDVLIVQDGGCSPGYNAVTAYVCEEFEKHGRRCFIASMGFKSLCSNQNSDYRVLVHDDGLFKLVSLAPGVVHAPALVHLRGAAFRTERFAEFKDEGLQKVAANALVQRKVKILVAIGGNGTFAGVSSLARFLPSDIQVFFIPVTIDSDVGGTETIGQHTAVEFGAEKIRCYVADAATHDRCYLLEMMGRDGGYHALYSAIGGGAHLALLPHSSPDLELLATRITTRSSTVIAVSEGYARAERERSKFFGNAAEYLLWQLRKTGKLDEKQRRVVCEPFSRDIRGASTNNSDLVLCKKFASITVQLAMAGKSRLMATVQSGVVGELPFDQVQTDNTVSADDEKLADRLN